MTITEQEAFTGLQRKLENTPYELTKSKSSWVRTMCFGRKDKKGLVYETHHISDMCLYVNAFIKGLEATNEN